MSCKYCDVKPPKKGQLRLCGSYPTGKPIFADLHYPSRYVFIAHLNGCPAIPNEDKWVLEFAENGTGTYIEISHCPMCGSELGIEAPDV